MSDLQLFFILYYTIILFFITVPILLLVLWIVNKWILKGKIRLLYRILLSFGIPTVLISIGIANLYYLYYSTDNMGERLGNLGVGISLPPYKITEYKNEHVIADDFRDTYHIVFKDSTIKAMPPTLDSLCNANSNWEKRNNEYVFHHENPENGFLDTLIIRPNKGTATFVRYKW